MSADRSGSIPSIRQQPPTAHPMAWGSNENQGPMPQSIFSGSFYNDSNENLSQISPGFAPGNGMCFPTDGEDRRPSIASATTVSSTGSKASVQDRVQKKLRGFFGENDVPVGNESRQNSEASSMQNGSLPPFAPGGAAARGRNNSMNDAMLRSGPPSPGSRPRTPAPQPSSEVTPWVFQDPEVR